MPAKNVNVLEPISLQRDHYRPVDGDEHANPTQKISRGSLRNWKGPLYLGSMSCFVVLCVNLGFIFWGTQRHSPHGQTVLYLGDCDKVKRMSTGMHEMINILSTTLLAGSNFSMVC